ncbi:FxSxx-COOH system tetratricopeptide repeat protein [Streptomyces sp. NBC_01498]|uniref:FxSxx-COOH system tetratricopeptide repeat protein n=1 Tax=Streptomyces sp. NBC_01498 TaxID=2975870 RepID=UPI002E7B7EB8|nr:FxSxx-COOH system tetratricopeptide repeat protein [Streptomyces sp. NBC_01498]WTL28167.1 FxSxx-COOH system tetratricopeptide repeat protein [Streptomyces sp. NBC_01498]
MSEAEVASRGARVAMFCSTAENIGQTSTLLSVAVTLAAGGHRVLVVDARRAGVRAADMLRRLLPPGAEPDSGRRDGSGRRDDGAPGATATVPAIPRTPGSLPPEHRWRISPDADSPVLSLVTLDEPDALKALPGRDAFPFGAYDRVLIDAPVFRTEDELDRWAHLPHTLVTCFSLNSWSIQAAAALAAGVPAAHASRIDVVAVGLQANPRMEDQLRLARDRVRRSFQPLWRPGRTRYVEIPFNAEYQREAALTTGQGATPDDRSLAPSFTQLADVLGPGAAGGAGQALVVHAPHHIAWAEWIEAQLAAAGVTVGRRKFTAYNGQRPSPDTMVLLVSPTGLRPERVDFLAELSHPNVRLVLVEEEAPPRRLSHHQQIDLRRLSEPGAAEALLRGLNMTAGAPVRGSRRLAFPNRDRRENIGARSPSFVGREDTLDRLRTALGTAGRTGGVCRVTGRPGAGKSEIAREFCHRFGGGYDVVWWLRAGSAKELDRSLTGLARAFGHDGTGDAVTTVRELQHAAASRAERWLLICDDIVSEDELDKIGGLLPPPSERCHVLATVRSADGAADSGAVLVEPFTDAESELLLSVMVPNLPLASARRIGQTIGLLPLSVYLAGAWLDARTGRGVDADNLMRTEAIKQAVDGFLAEFDAHQKRLLGVMPAVPLPRVLLDMAFASLDRTAAARVWARATAGGDTLVWLAEVCALLAGAGMDLPLLRSSQMQEALVRPRRDPPYPGDAPLAAPDPGSGDAGTTPAPGPGTYLNEPLMVDVALWALHRYGLVDFDFARPDEPVRMHGLVKELVVQRLGTRRTAREAELREVVSRYEPGADTAGHREGAPARKYRDRRARQVEALSLWEDTRPHVRGWLLGHLHDLVRSGDKVSLEEALRIAEFAVHSWDDGRTPEYLRLLTLKSQAHRRLGQYGHAGRLARRALQGYRALLGPEHPRALQTNRLYSAGLRAVGEFSEALNEDDTAAQGVHELLGPRHEATALVEHTLALSLALNGNYRKALRLVQNLYDQRQAIGGPDSPRVRDLVPFLAAMHRNVGQNAESYDLLSRAGLRRPPSGTPEPGIAMRVDTENGLAVSERRLGRPDQARERDERMRRLALQGLGEQHLATLRCRFSLATDLAALGEDEEAVAESERCLTQLENTLGEAHPFALLCRVRLAVHLRGAGRYGEALEIGDAALEGLRQRVNTGHPWVMAAAVGVAGTLFVSGRLDEAAALEKFARDGYDQLEMSRHPYRAVAADNLAITEAELASKPHTPGMARRRGDIDLELPGV